MQLWCEPFHNSARPSRKLPQLAVDTAFAVRFGHGFDLRKKRLPLHPGCAGPLRSRNVPFEYVNVKKNPADLQRMLKYSKGARRVPVIVDGEKVTVGFGGT